MSSMLLSIPRSARNDNPKDTNGRAAIGGALVWHFVRFPRIEDLNTKPGEVFHVAGDDAQFMFMRRCRDHTVRCVEGCSAQLRFSVEDSPAVRDSLSDGQDSAGKPGEKIALQPAFQVGAPLGVAKDRETFPNFTERHDA
jgi:hypothetical protein